MDYGQEEHNQGLREAEYETQKCPGTYIELHAKVHCTFSSTPRRLEEEVFSPASGSRDCGWRLNKYACATFGDILRGTRAEKTDRQCQTDRQRVRGGRKQKKRGERCVQMRVGRRNLSMMGA